MPGGKQLGLGWQTVEIENGTNKTLILYLTGTIESLTGT